MDNENKQNAADTVSTAYSLSIMLARATESDPHANVLATQIALLLRKGIKDLGFEKTQSASSSA